MTSLTTLAPTSSGADTEAPTGSGTTAETSAAGGSTGFKFDLGGSADLDPTGDSGGVPSCKVTDDMDATGPCGDKAPPDSFDPEVQWSWAWGPGSRAPSATRAPT